VDVVTLPGYNPGPWTGAGNHTYLLTGRVPTLIDAGVGDQRHLDRLQAALDDHGRQTLSQVLVTHGHSDHASGAPAIAKRWPKVTFRKMPWPDVDREIEVGWVPLRDHELVEAGDGALRVVHTPGHAPDHLCFLDEPSGTLFCGDLAILGGTVVIPASRGGCLVDYLESIERVRALAPRRLLPAHGDEISNPELLLSRYVTHRRLREQQIVKALDTLGETGPDELVQYVYRGVPDDLRGAARETVLAQLAKLQAEGRVRPVGPRWILEAVEGPGT
jgi:glyoxylase-like metal-dependent hydrolase (beta-lactamase superfamily II)